MPALTSEEQSAIDPAPGPGTPGRTKGGHGVAVTCGVCGGAVRCEAHGALGARGDFATGTRHHAPPSGGPPSQVKCAACGHPIKQR